MNLSSNGWSLSLDLNGGRIQNLVNNGVKVFGTYQRIDGKVGNTHICVPSFDKEGQDKYGLPFHGLVRNMKWHVIKKSISSVTISCTTFSSQEYPATLMVEQEFDLKNSFVHIVRVTNTQGSGVPVNIGVHYYWDTPKGWRATTMDDQNIAHKIESNGYVDLKKECSIIFPHASYQVRVEGFRSVVLWTSYKANDQGNKSFSDDFCCIEPVIEWPHFFGSKTSILRSGATVSASICVKKVV
ncbi:MAG: hypothetical protein V1922_01620 [bacterium]